MLPGLKCRLCLFFRCPGSAGAALARAYHGDRVATVGSPPDATSSLYQVGRGGGAALLAIKDGA